MSASWRLWPRLLSSGGDPGEHLSGEADRPA
jgi:hypothetical protein